MQLSMLKATNIFDGNHVVTFCLIVYISREVCLIAQPLDH